MSGAPSKASCIQLAGTATPEAARQAFAATYEALSTRVDALLALPLADLEPAELVMAASRIHAFAATSE